MPGYTPLEPAQLDWQQQQPISTRYQDVYFSRAGGLAETEYVFLAGNQLPERWLAHSDFTIAETGFGTGLNFLCAAQLWLKHTHSGCLHFISVEKHPLQLNDLQQALLMWPELAALSQRLVELYPPLSSGYHLLELIPGRVRLTLMLGDAVEQYSQLQAQVDAWFLDGFSPNKNPDMWCERLYAQLKRLSKAGTTFATFTAAGHVKRALQTQGFLVEKRKGFGHKREMLVGSFSQNHHAPHHAPWFVYPPAAQQREAIVLGGGLAGCSTAFALAQRQFKVTLIEAQPALAQAASGNPAGVMMPRLSRNMSLDSQFYLAAFLYSARLLKQLNHASWQACGVLQFGDEHLFDTSLLPAEIVQLCSATQASQLSGIPLNQGGLYFPLAGYLSPPALCQHLIELAQAELKLNTPISHLQYQQGRWQVWQQQQLVAEAETLILCNGYQANELLPHSEIYPLVKTRGQLAYLPDTQSLQIPLCYEGYLLPGVNGIHCCGTTYSVHDHNPAVSHHDQQQILAQLQQAVPHFSAPAPCGGRVAFRTSSRDYLPLVGPIPDWAFYQQHYHNLHHGKPAKHYPNAHALPGLYLNTGHGSRGLTSCLLSAELLAAQLSQQALPLPEAQIHLLHPARFLLRQLKRRIYDTPTKP